MDLIPDVGPRVVEPEPVEVLREAGRVTLRRPKFGPGRSLVLRILRQDTHFTVRLDRLGSAAWALFDGRRTVADVRRQLEADFPDEPDIRARLGKFLGVLVSQRMVRLR
jgi:hypothetical protein